MIQIRSSPHESDFVICDTDTTLALYTSLKTLNTNTVRLVRSNDGWVPTDATFNHYPTIICELQSVDDLSNYPELLV